MVVRNARQRAAAKINAGPWRSLVSRTPTAAPANPTSTQLLPPLPLLRLDVRQAVESSRTAISTQPPVPLPPLRLDFHHFARLRSYAVITPRSFPDIPVAPGRRS